MAAELEATRARALEAERVRASVALARGVAHELKNTLTPLKLAVRTLQQTPQLGAAGRESLEVIEAESQRLDALARAFSQFGRPPEGPPSEIDISELLDHLARTHLPPQVERRFHGNPDTPSVNGYYEPLSRAFANLLLNAAEALGDAGGSVEIVVDHTPEGEVEIRISDTGPGLPADSADRIWDPDFTTKARGTGLGLSLVRQTIHAHGGRISAADRGGGGAEFRVHLPGPSAALVTASSQAGETHLGGRASPIPGNTGSG
jgi:signal transduction histidine kinase